MGNSNKISYINPSEVLLEVKNFIKPHKVLTNPNIKIPINYSNRTNINSLEILIFSFKIINEVYKIDQRNYFNLAIFYPLSQPEISSNINITSSFNQRDSRNFNDISSIYPLNNNDNSSDSSGTLNELFLFENKKIKSDKKKPNPLKNDYKKNRSDRVIRFISMENKIIDKELKKVNKQKKSNNSNCADELKVIHNNLLIINKKNSDLKSNLSNIKIKIPPSIKRNTKIENKNSTIITSEKQKAKGNIDKNNSFKKFSQIEKKTNK